MQCDLVATNLSRNLAWLAREAMQGAAHPLQRLPVFSNVEESLDIPPVRARRPAMAVFGLPGTRRKSYDRLSGLGRLLEKLGIEEIVDIGPDCEAPSQVCGIGVDRKGVLAAAEIAGLLSGSIFGFVPHPPFCLVKSGIFAGLCAHGAIPILAESFAGEMDGLVDGVHLVTPKSANSALGAGLERCSIAAWRWYSEHRLHVHAAAYARWLVQPPAKAETETASEAGATQA